jgi:type I restriction enzyme S subunit
LEIGVKIVIPTKERLLKEVSGSYTYFADNDVLLAKITPCFENGKLGIARNLKNGIGFGSSEYFVFRSNGELLPDYLYYFLSRDEFRQEASSLMSGAVGHKRVPKEYVENLQIPVPPLPEQRRIVKILDQVFEAVAKAKANAEKNLKNARELFESYLECAFSECGGDRRKLAEAAIITNGYSFKSGDFSPRNSVKSIKITNVGVREFVEETDNYLPFKFRSEYSKFLVSSGDIVLALTRSIIAAGLKVAIVPETYDASLLNQRVASIRGAKGITTNEYLYYFFCSGIAIQYVLKQVVSLMQPNLSLRDLENLHVPVPALTEQRSIVAKLDALSAETKKLESNYKQKLSDLEELKKSVLKKAFAGEL